MAEDKSFSLINTGDWSKPAIVLIEKISTAVGGLVEPWQIRRVAQAKADAAITKTTSDIEITDLQRRGIRRWVFGASYGL